MNGLWIILSMNGLADMDYYVTVLSNLLDTVVVPSLSSGIIFQFSMGAHMAMILQWLLVNKLLILRLPISSFIQLKLILEMYPIPCRVLFAVICFVIDLFPYWSTLNYPGLAHRQALELIRKMQKQ